MFDFDSYRKKLPEAGQETRVYGAFGYREGLSGQIIPDPRWARDNLVKVEIQDLPGWPALPSGELPSGVTVHRLVAPLLVATWAEVRRQGLSGQLRTYDGAYNPRHMGHDSGRPLSVHSWGAAIDLDAHWNGYGAPLSLAGISRDVVAVFERCGWTWGGRWTGRYTDAMHFQATQLLPGTSWDAAPIYEKTPPTFGPPTSIGPSRQAPAAVDKPAPVVIAPVGTGSERARVTLTDLAGHELDMDAPAAVYGGVLVERLAGGQVKLTRQ